jgi:hypothetical protein
MGNWLFVAVFAGGFVGGLFYFHQEFNELTAWVMASIQ